MGFWVELLTHIKRHFRVQVREYNLLVVDLFQTFTFCTLLVIASNQFHRHARLENNYNAERNRDTTLKTTKIDLWYSPSNKDAQHEMQRIVEGMEFNNDVKVTIRGFISWQHMIDKARKNFSKSNRHGILVVEINNNSNIRFTLRSLQGFNWNEIFTFLTGAYGLGLVDVTCFPLSCLTVKEFRSSLFNVIFFACLVDGSLVSYFVGKERSRYFDAALYTSASLLIRNSKTAIIVTTVWQINSFYLAKNVTCISFDKWWTIFIPHLILGCRCLRLDIVWIQTHSMMSCYGYVFMYYLICVLLGCLALTPLSSWPQIVMDYIHLRNKTDSNILQVLEESFPDDKCDKDFAITIKSLSKIPSVVPEGFTLRIPYLKTTVILDTSGTSRSAVLDAVVGNVYGRYKTVSVERRPRSTVCYCPSFDFMWDKLTVKEVLETFYKFVSGASSSVENFSNSLVEDFNLKELNIKLHQLSVSERKRIMLAGTFLSSAEILVLDDPTFILRGKSLKMFISCVMKKKGRVTILMTCSTAQDAVRIADRIAIVVDGQIRVFGSVPFVTTSLGVGTHIRVALYSNKRVQDLLFYLWLNATSCLCLQKLDTKKDKQDDTNAGPIYNFFISKMNRKSVEFIILKMYSRKSYFGILELHVSDVGIDNVLDRCKSSLLLESALHCIYHNAIPIHKVIERWNLKQMKMWNKTIEDHIQYSNVGQYLGSNEDDLGSLSKFSECNVAATKRLLSDISFKDFMNVITRRYNLKQSRTSPALTASKEEKSESGQTNDMTNQANTSKNCDEDTKTKDCNDKWFLMHQSINEEHCASTSVKYHVVNEGLVQFNSKSGKSRYKDAQNDSLQLSHMGQFLNMGNNFKDGINPGPEKNLVSLKNNSGDNSRLDNSNNNMNEVIKLHACDMERLYSYTFEDFAQSLAYSDDCSDQDRCAYFSNTNNNSSVDPGLQSTDSSASISSSINSIDNNISNDAEVSNNFSEYCDFVIWGINKQQSIRVSLEVQDRVSKSYTHELSALQVFQSHAKALLYMSACHLWNCVPLILLGFVLALLTENFIFFLTSSQVDYIIQKTQTKDVKNYARQWKDETYHSFKWIDPSICNGSDCRNETGIYCDSRVSFYGYQLMNDTSVGIYYNKEGQDPKILSTAMAMESIQRIRQDLGNARFLKSHRVSVDPMPLVFKESVKLLSHELETHFTNGAFGITLASVFIFFCITLGYLFTAVHQFQTLLMLSGVSGILIYLTQLLSCFIVHFGLMVLVHLSACLFSVMLENNLSPVLEIQTVVLLITSQLFHSASVFSIITLLLQFTSRKTLIWIWSLFEVFTFGLSLLTSKFWWTRIRLSQLEWILLLLFPTMPYTKANYHNLQYATLRMILTTLSSNEDTRWHPREKANQDPSCINEGATNEHTEMLCVDGVQETLMMAFILQCIQTMICFLIYFVVCGIRLCMTSSKQGKKSIKSRKGGSHKRRESHVLKIIDLRVHPKFVVGAAAADLISTTCKPTHCLTLYDCEDNSGVSSLLQLIMGHDNFYERQVTIGKNYFPQFHLLGSKQRMGIGYCPKEDMLNPVLTGRCILTLFAQLRSASDIESTVDNTLTVLSMMEVADKQIYMYSNEDKRKLHVAITIVGSPPILILDHPTKGLDPLTKVKVWDNINTLRKNGHVLVLASDCADECCAVGTYVYVMKGGTIQLQSSIAFVRQQVAGYFAYVWMSQDDKGITVPVVRLLREVQRHFRSGMFSIVENTRDPYILLSFANIIPDLDHPRIYYAMEDLKDAGLVRNYLVQEVTPALTLSAYRNHWLPY